MLDIVWAVLALIVVIILGVYFWYCTSDDTPAPNTIRYWNSDSQLPGETFKSFALRQGISQVDIDEVLSVHGIENPKDPRSVFATFISENIHTRPDLLGEASHRKYVNTPSELFVDSKVLTEDDWSYFIRSPRVWKSLHGQFGEIEIEIMKAYLDWRIFHPDKYQGVFTYHKD